VVGAVVVVVVVVVVCTALLARVGRDAGDWRRRGGRDEVARVDEVEMLLLLLLSGRLRGR